ncbi:hypothetical protein BCR39DRAFT_332994 [Naematelia encephala]|uniref:Uncharacterized protein n=1 Tax=Naematelia encephala TaxID=71784 RepID=A0A1Y2BF78_9TREE|nr:hypothetical protein BCR39DRAFT_332994 [Naematelia encephala]
MNTTQAIAGPSHFFPTPFKVQDYRPTAPSTSSRHSTPAFRYERYRSASVVSRTAEDDLPKKRYHSVLRLRTTWDLLLEKYGSIRPEDDDEVDLRTGRIVRDRGRLRELQPREFGEISEPEQEEDEDAEGSSMVGGPDKVAFDSDEDELGGWDGRSGLDEQEPDLGDEVQEGLQRILTAEDEDDLQAFLRAERMRKEERGEDPDEEENTDAWTDDASLDSDDNGEWNMSPRHHGTRVSMASLEDLFPEDSAEEDNSEDELVAATSDAEDATRVTPAPPRRHSRSSSTSSSSSEREVQRRPRRVLEVVIIRSRSRSAMTSAPQRSRSFPSISAPSQPVIKARPSLPSLATLFTPPPPQEEGSSSAQPLRRRGRPRRLSTVERESTALVVPETHYSGKGKNRMPGERPEEAVSSAQSRYYDYIAQSGLSGRPRTCVACRNAGGTRAAKAVWCKGRKAASFCTFENGGNAKLNLDKKSTTHPRPTEDAAPATKMLSRLFTPLPGDLDSQIPHISTRRAIPAQSLASHKRSGTREQSFVPPERPRRLDPRRYLLNTAINHNGSNIRRCQPCRKAGGERAENAPWCKGRSVWTGCTFVKDQQRQAELEAEREAPHNALHEVTTTQSAASHVDQSIAESEIDDLESIPDVGPDSTSRIVDKSLASAEDIDGDGSEKLLAASVLDPERYVTGLLYPTSDSQTPRRCPHCRRAGGERAVNAAYCKGRQWSKHCTFHQETNPIAGADSQDPPVRSRSRRALSMVSAGAATTPTPVIRSTNSTRLKRKRTVLTPPPSSPASDQETGSVAGSTSASMRPSVRIASVPAVSGSLTSQPSSPSEPQNLVPKQVFWRANSLPKTGLSTRPTPSPTVSFAAQTSLPPSSPPRAIIPLRHKTIGIRPTPSPSLLNARSSSFSSDKRLVALPLRSALRQPSIDSSSPLTRTVKRARFSLAPRSPPRQVSSDALQDSHSEDDAWVDTSSPASSLPRFSPADSSSPFPREMAVRAADVGLNLGPEHTGRLPSGLLAALVPAFGGTRLTLGSSMETRHSETSYTLPTPPPSFGSTSSAAARQLVKTTTPSDAGKNGLMLPPPVPPKRLLSARPMTPLSITSTSTEDDQPSSADLSSSEIRFISGSSLDLRARSRSRSMSVAPHSTPGPSSRVLPATTPRKRSRLERELARVAREVGDEAGLEWGMDEDVGEDLGRMWREGSVVRPLI